jgi:hypothetical protein
MAGRFTIDQTFLEKEKESSTVEIHSYWEVRATVGNDVRAKTPHSSVATGFLRSCLPYSSFWRCGCG